LLNDDPSLGLCLLQACISIVLNRKTIVALQLDVTPASVARCLLIAPKLKLKQGHIRRDPSCASKILLRTCISIIPNTPTILLKLCLRHTRSSIAQAGKRAVGSSCVLARH